MRSYIYARYSPRPQAQDCDSCEKQAERCIEFCKQKGWSYVTPYNDKDVSGVDIERFGLNELIRDLSEETHKCIVVIDSPDRLARDLMVGLVLRERITRAGGLITYADGSPSGNSPEDVFIANMFLALATLERDRVSYRTSRGLKKRQANGEYFGKAPIGYMRPDGKGTTLVPNMQEREAVKKARHWFKIGHSASAIAQQLQDIFGFRGGHWKAKTVKRMARKTHRWEKGHEEFDMLVDFKTSVHK